MNILVTCCEGIAGRNTIWSLRQTKEDFYIVGTDISVRRRSLSGADITYRVPKPEDEEYINSILDICNKEEIDIVFPLNTKEMIKLLRNKQIFTAKIMGDNVEAIEIAGNKGKMLNFLKKKDLPHPKFKIVNNMSDLIWTVQNFDYPDKKVVFKRTDSAGCRGFRILDRNCDEQNMLFNEKPGTTITKLETILQFIHDPIPELVVMEYLEGTDYTVYSLVNNGKALYTIPMRRYGLVPGMSLGGIAEKNNIIIEFVNKISKTFNFNSYINYQLILRDGKPMLYEINPRLSATTILCTAVGVNMPYFLMKMLLNQKVPRKKILWGTEIIRYYNEMFYKFGGT